MLLTWLPFLVAVILTSTQGCESYKMHTKLLLVQILSRHAERTPVKLYETDPNPKESWPEGLGKLTSLGKYQAYSMGKLFRRKYEQFITTNPNEVTVNSSIVDRCIRSALATVASFYSPRDDWVFDEDIDWQPIPVHTIPESEDRYLNCRAPCPRMEEESKKVLDAHMKILRENHKKMIHILSHHTKEPLNTVLSLALLQDTLKIERRRGLKIPLWAKHYWDELESAVEPILSWFSESPVVRRLRIGPLLGRIVEDMKEKSVGGIPDIKVRLYNTHDIHIANMLTALKVFNEKRTPYCASVVFELHQTHDEKFVRLLYLNSTTPEVIEQESYPLILEGCSEYCPLEHFEKIAQDIVPVDWKAECQLDCSRFTDADDSIMMLTKHR